MSSTNPPPYAKGGGQPQQRQQQQQPRPSAWQPNPPRNTANMNSSLQQAASTTGGSTGPPAYQPQQQQQPPQNPYARQANPYAAYHHYGAPYYQQQHAAAVGAYGRPPSSWQPAPPNYRPQPGVYYPPPQQPQQQSQPQAKPQRKALTITDKDGNVIDLSDTKKTGQQASSLVVAAAAACGSDAGAKMRQLALERIQAADKKDEQDKAKREEDAKKETEEKAMKEAEEKAQKEAEERSQREAEEKAQKEAEEKARREAEEKARKEAEEKAQREAKAKQEAQRRSEEEARQKQQTNSISSLASRMEKVSIATPRASGFAAAVRGEGVGLRPGGGLHQSPPKTTTGNGKRLVYTKEELMKFREMECCLCRPDDVPDMTIVRVQVQGGGGGGGGRRRSGGGGGGGGDWSRGMSQPRDQQQRRTSKQGGDQWQRGVAPPKPPPNKGRGGGGGRGGGRGGQQAPLYDGPVAPLTKSENRWRPKKNSSPMVVTEKKVTSILNKMTKEKFDKLSAQMCEIPILSYEMLTMMIHQVYEKAIDQPAFGDMYADLCVKLSETAQSNSFIQIINSDEEPPTEEGEQPVSKEGNQTYRWSNDVGLEDSEVVGPFASSEECVEAALDPDNSAEPLERGGMEMLLVGLFIREGMFVKVMKKKHPSDGEQDTFYTVFFQVNEADECGQQLSSQIFLSELECKRDANKQNSFRRSLLNKCEDEFNKKDIYVDWKKEMKAYEATKSKLSAAEQAEQEGELDFRRIRIKKQMLGNVKFIGQLYKKNLLKEKIMRYCIASTLKLDEMDKSKNPEYKDSGDMDMDEEDHEAVCSLFTTIGKTIDKPPAAAFMQVCFDKIEQLSNNQKLPSRSRFMYKDLIELRQNNWKLRRKVETAKTLEEIRKEADREERMQAQQSQQMGGYRGGRGGGDRRDRDYGNRDRRDGGYRGNNDNRGKRGSTHGGSRRQSQKPLVQADDDGFTTVVRGAGTRSQQPLQPMGRTGQASRSPGKGKSFSPKARAPSRSPSPEQAPPSAAQPALSPDKLKRRIDNIRNEYQQDPSNIDELLLSIDELKGTPDSGMTLVAQNVERIMECKEDERKAINAMLPILFEKHKLTKDEVANGFADVVEFIESFVVDAPFAYKYLGELLATMLQIKALEVTWLFEQCMKLMADGREKLMKSTVEAVKALSGPDGVKSIFSGKPESDAASDVLGSQVWASILQSATA